MIYRLAWLTLLFIITGCSKTLVKGDVIGVFASGNVQKLELRANGTYQNTFLNSEGRPVTNEGTWEFEVVEDAPTVTLLGFRSPLPGASASGRGFYLMQVKRNGGKVRLYIDNELGLFLEKQTEPSVDPKS